MASSPTDRLREIARLYDGALEALMRDDLARVERLLGQADGMLDALGANPPSDLPLEEWEKTQESLGRLLSAMGNVREHTLDELNRVRHGKHALKRYGARGGATGTHHDSDV